MREEQLADLLGDVIAPIQISEQIAESIACALRTTEQDAEHRRVEALSQLNQRRRVVISKLDRGYEDYLESRISSDFWRRKSQEWEAELQTIDRERTRHQQPNTVATVKAAKILELAKQAENLYKSQVPAERAGCWIWCYRTALSIAEVFVPLTLSRSTCSCEGTKPEIGGEGGIRCRSRRAPHVAANRKTTRTGTD
jgi:hypothetical protein